MQARIHFFSLTCLLWFGLSPLWCQDGPRAPDFAREVRPLLARYCFKCHGPDETTRKAKLRLDVPGKLEDGVIVPGQPEHSEVVARVFAADLAKRMPPPATKTALSADQKNLLKQWIASGAKYERHWAF